MSRYVLDRAGTKGFDMPHSRASWHWATTQRSLEPVSMNVSNACGGVPISTWIEYDDPQFFTLASACVATSMICSFRLNCSISK